MCPFQHTCYDVTYYKPLFFHHAIFCTHNLPCYEYQGEHNMPSSMHQGSYNMSNTIWALVICPKHSSERSKTYLVNNAKEKGIGKMSCTLKEKFIVITTMSKHIVRERMNTLSLWRGFVRESHFFFSINFTSHKNFKGHCSLYISFHYYRTCFKSTT
jgi:hypothetical protein